jgi:hypothetical protein
MNPDFFASAAEVGPLGALPLTEGLHEDAEMLGGDYLLLGRIGEEVEKLRTFFVARI